MSSEASMPARRSGRYAGAALALALMLLLLGFLMIAAAGPAYQWEWLSLRAAFRSLRYGTVICLGAGLLALLALLSAAWYRHYRMTLLGLLLVLLCAAITAVPLQQWRIAKTVPPIHDITTDTENPPAFAALVQARERAPNAVDYPGAATARQQREAYPDITPLYLPATPTEVQQAVRAEIRARGWELAAFDEDRIEATATTTWFGFKDDVVIRLQESADGTRVDMRSASRVGRGDVGANAERIRSFLAALERRLAGQ